MGALVLRYGVRSSYEPSVTLCNANVCASVTLCNTNVGATSIYVTPSSPLALSFTSQPLTLLSLKPLTSLYLD